MPVLMMMLKMFLKELLNTDFITFTDKKIFLLCICALKANIFYCQKFFSCSFFVKNK